MQIARHVPPGWSLSGVTATTFYGSSPLGAAALLDRLTAGVAPERLPGDFVLAAEGADAAGPYAALFSSVLATPPYFVHQGPDAVVHGPTVLDVCRRAGLRWEWDAGSVESLALFDHVIGAATLHRRVERLGAGAALLLRGGQVERLTFASSAPEPLRLSVEALVERVAEAVGEALRGRRVVVSLTAGYDSRAVLALCLRHRADVVAATVGDAETTDAIVAARVADAAGAAHRVVPFEADVLAHAGAVLRATSGTLPVRYWHTALFGERLEAGRLHLTGVNGEQARTPLLNAGVASRLADALPAGPAMEAWLRMRFGTRRRLGASVRFFQPETPPDAIRSARRATRGAGSLLERLDCFHTAETVRHLGGNLLALMRQRHETASPFLDAAFVDGAPRLARSARLNSHFHVALIRACAPALLRFPVDATARAMARHKRPLYWAHPRPMHGASPVPHLLASPAVRDAVTDDRRLDLFVPAGVRRRLVAEQRQSAVSFLLTMHLFLDVLAEEGLLG